MNSSLTQERFYDVAKAAEKKFESLECSAINFKAAGRLSLFSTLLSTVIRAGAGNCTCFERVGHLSVPTHQPALSSFYSWEQSCVLFEKSECFGRMKGACHFHYVWSLSFGFPVHCHSCKKAVSWARPCVYLYSG